MKIPIEFGEEFLKWFRETTEAVWAHAPRHQFDEIGNRLYGYQWQTGTRWLGGLSESDVNAVERALSLRFPPDFRLFLHVLHATDRPMFCDHMADAGDDGTLRSPRDAMLTGIDDESSSISYCPGFFNWLALDDLRANIARIEATIIDDVEGGFWLTEWGPPPASAEEARRRVRVFLDEAPKLAPLHAHRCLVLEPCRAGNPVLSIWGTDTIVYGEDLQAYLLNEFNPLFSRAFGDEWYAACEEYNKACGNGSARNPSPDEHSFWGGLIAQNHKLWMEAQKEAERNEGAQVTDGASPTFRKKLPIRYAAARF